MDSLMTGRILLSVLTLMAATLTVKAEYVRIASINLATDQLLLQLVERERIVALSFMAADPELSMLAEKAAGIPGLRGDAEEILRLQPDLLLAGEHGNRQALAFAERQGIPVLRLPVPNTFSEVREVITVLGRQLGAEEEARRLIEEMNNRLHVLEQKTSLRPERPTALAVGHGGHAHGSISMMHAVLEAAGFRNTGAEMGIVFERRLTLEQVLTDPPRFLVSTRYHPEHPTLGDRFLSHRALRQVAGQMDQLEIPLAWITASNNLTVQAAESLHKQASRHLP